MSTIDADRYRRAQALVHELLQRPGQDPVTFLDSTCVGDVELRREVECLLASIETSHGDESNTELLGRNIDEIAHAAFGDVRIAPTVAAHYRLIKCIGEGGMGQVWLAEREQGVVRQRVALKMLRGAGLGGEAALARFLEEGRILGALNHRNIAHLVEAGQGGDGVPFLAMEFVDGQSVDRWCESHALGLRARIELFLKVCAAVEYAHAQLVIHRDLKPANILVDDVGEPKLLDFGIARLVDSDAERGNSVTATRAMTLAYASPEQIEGRRLGTASDIYSLGVVLYQLLTGVRPFDHLETDHARSNAIVSGDVSAPSEVAGRRTASAGRSVPKRIPVDVDAVVLKALRREPSQRYASVAEFADDLRAFLASRPVLARRGQFGYVVRRFGWRNRWLIAGSSLMLVLASTFTWRTVVAEHEAREQAAISNRVSEFLVSVFAASDSDVNRSLTHELTAREVLDAGAARIDTELADQPRIRARLLEAVGNAYRHMNANAKGVSLLREAADIYLDPSIDQPLDGGRVLEAMANAMANGQFPARDAEVAARHSLALAERLTAPGSQSIANAWMVLSLALNRAGNLRAAEHAARTTYAMNERLPKDENNRFDAATGNLCIILTNRGLLAEAAAFCNKSYDARRARGRELILAMAASRLSQLHAAQGDYPKALALSAEALQLTNELKGDVSPFGTVFTSRRAAVLDAAGQHAEAQVLFKKALADAIMLDGPESGEVLDARLQLARHQSLVGDSSDAIEALRDIVPQVAARYGDDDPRALVAKTVFAQALLDSGVADAFSRQLIDDALLGWNVTDDPDAVQPSYTRLALAQWWVINGDKEAAMALLDQIDGAESRADHVVRSAAAAWRAGL